MNNDFTIALVGNPNCGKTTLFNALTGSNQKVANWPGVTVEKKIGHFKHANANFKLVDLPGTYSLHISCETDSIDQQIAQHFILGGSADLIINIIDASSLERGLYLTTQLMEAGTPLVIALNMIDVADQNGVHIDPYDLSEKIGFPVVPMIASRSEGTGTLIDVASNHLYKDSSKPQSVIVSKPLEDTANKILSLMNQYSPGSSRLKVTAAMEQDGSVLDGFPKDLQNRIRAEVDLLASKLTTSISDTLITDRYNWIEKITADSVHHETKTKKIFSDYLDAVLLNRFFAFPIFLGIMYLMFMVAINFGGAFIDFFDMTTGAIFVEAPRQMLTALNFPPWLVTFISDGAGGGIQLVASFIPVIGTLFIFQTFLEDSGYMARAAFILDRLMRSLGLPGKSFVPLVIGFGCNVPSVMGSRTLDSNQDRLLTTLMAPFMSCGARLTVYILFATAFFAENGHNVVFGLYIIGIILALLTGLLVRQKILSRDISPFIMELHNYHTPTLRGLFTHTWHRLHGFIVRAGKAIVLVVIILNFVNSISLDGTFNNENTSKSLLSVIGKTITPVFSPLGIKEDNWPATVGLFSGIFAKEVVVGTLDSLYSNMARDKNSALEEVPMTINDRILEAFATIPENLAKVNSMWKDPLGLSMDNLEDEQTSVKNQNIEVSTITLMQELFDGPIAAFSYILFILLYMPCVATLGAIYKEAGKAWAIFSATWNTLLAYGVSVIVYQVGTFTAHPQQSILWAASMVLMLFCSYLLLIAYGKTTAKNENLIPIVNLH